MRTRPPDLAESDLIVALTNGWGLKDVDLEHLPIGAGSHHWRCTDGKGTRHFVTVDDLDRKPFLGEHAAEVFEHLRSALETARTLRSDAELDFVVSPLDNVDGEVLTRVGTHYAVAFYPFLGDPQPFRKVLTGGERTALVDMLGRLHGSSPGVAATARVIVPSVPLREDLENALRDLDADWAGGPYSGPARSTVARNAGLIMQWLERFDELEAGVDMTAAKPVLTHGEPHSGNIVRSRDRFLLVDWDTAGLAPAERDLWMIGRGDPTLCELYRLRWRLDDLSWCVHELRSAHRQDEDSERAWRGLCSSIEREPFTRD